MKAKAKKKIDRSLVKKLDAFEKSLEEDSAVPKDPTASRSYANQVEL